MYSVLEVIRMNPDFQAIDLLNHFEKELKMAEQTVILQSELSHTQDARTKLRVLRAKRLEVEERLRSIRSDIDMEVFLAYPPRKGSDVEREHMRLKLQKENEAFKEATEEFKEFTRQIVEKEDRLEDISIACRSARRTIELFNTYAAFITEYKKGCIR